MDIRNLAEDILVRRRTLSPRQRYLVGIAGIPASGKSFVAHRIREEINALVDTPVCAILPMDGCHLRRSELKLDELAIRGNPCTFNAALFAKTVLRLKDISNVIDAPIFDHALQDPVERGVTIGYGETIVLIEGLYTFLPDWKIHGLAPSIFDMRLFIHAPRSIVESRIINRHVHSGICKDNQEALRRWHMNDLPNGLLVIESIEKMQSTNSIIDYIIINLDHSNMLTQSLNDIALGLAEFRL